jgi:hypothetical protein
LMRELPRGFRSSSLQNYLFEDCWFGHVTLRAGYAGQYLCPEPRQLRL